MLVSFRLKLLGLIASLPLLQPVPSSVVDEQWKLVLIRILLCSKGMQVEICNKTQWASTACIEGAGHYSVRSVSDHELRLKVGTTNSFI